MEGEAERRKSGSRADLPRIPIGERNKTRFFLHRRCSDQEESVRGGGDGRVRGYLLGGQDPGWSGLGWSAHIHFN